MALQEKGEKQSEEELHRSHGHRDFCREGSPHNPHYEAKRKESEAGLEEAAAAAAAAASGILKGQDTEPSVGHDAHSF